MIARYEVRVKRNCLMMAKFLCTLISNRLRNRRVAVAVHPPRKGWVMYGAYVQVDNVRLHRWIRKGPGHLYYTGACEVAAQRFITEYRQLTGVQD